MKFYYRHYKKDLNSYISYIMILSYHEFNKSKWNLTHFYSLSLNEQIINRLNRANSIFLFQKKSN